MTETLYITGVVIWVGLFVLFTLFGGLLCMSAFDEEVDKSLSKSNLFIGVILSSIGLYGLYSVVESIISVW